MDRDDTHTPGTESNNYLSEESLISAQPPTVLAPVCGKPLDAHSKTMRWMRAAHLFHRLGTQGKRKRNSIPKSHRQEKDMQGIEPRQPGTIHPALPPHRLVGGGSVLEGHYLELESGKIHKRAVRAVWGAW